MEEEKVVKKFSFVKLVLVLLIMYIIGFLCYKVAISKEIVKQANIQDDEEIKVYAGENKIIIEKVSK